MVILGFMILYGSFGIFPNQSRRGREPILLSEDPDRFWMAIGIGVFLGLAICFGIARLLRR